MSVFIVEMKVEGKWEVAAGSTANTRREHAEEEMKDFQADNPGVPFRVVQYFRADEGVKA